MGTLSFPVLATVPATPRMTIKFEMKNLQGSRLNELQSLAFRTGAWTPFLLKDAGRDCVY